MSIWCEHCRDHFDVDHYDEDGDHIVGPDAGPFGALLADAETKTVRNSLQAVFVDRIVRHKMDQQDIEIEEAWLDDSDDELIVWDRIPPRLQGPVQAMRDNALDLADQLIGALQRRLR